MVKKQQINSMEKKSKITPPKIIKTRKDRIDPERIVDAYKYYFQDVPEKHIKRLILANQRYCEQMVFQKRLFSFKKKCFDQTIFEDYVFGSVYAEISIKYNVSLRVVTESIFNIRLRLIEGIETDVLTNSLSYSPTKLNTSFKAAQNDFCKEKRYIEVSKKILTLTNS